MWHVFPSNDLREHTINSECNCEPILFIMDNGELLYVHKSYDGREHIEKLYKFELN